MLEGVLSRPRIAGAGASAVRAGAKGTGADAVGGIGTRGPGRSESGGEGRHTVIHSHALMVQPNQSLGSVNEKAVVSTEPIHTTNITGDLSWRTP